MLSISKFRVPLLLSLLSHGQAAALADHPRRVNTGGERWFSRGAEECVAQVVGPEARAREHVLMRPESVRRAVVSLLLDALLCLLSHFQVACLVRVFSQNMPYLTRT